jgi:hypothetical protein
MGLHDVVDLSDGRAASIPDRLPVRCAERAHELMQTRVGHHREMRRGMAGVDQPAASPIDDGDRATRICEEVRRREARHPGAYDNDVYRSLVIELWKRRQRG